MNIKILAQDVQHSLIFIGSLDDYERGSLGHQSTKIFFGPDSQFENVVIFADHRGTHFIFDSKTPAYLNFARKFVVAVIDNKPLLWRQHWLEAQSIDIAWSNGWMTFFNDRFVMMADDDCLIYIDNDHENIDYQHFNEIITEIRIENNELKVTLWS